MLGSDAAFSPQSGWAQAWLKSLGSARRLGAMNYLHTRAGLVRGPFGYLIDLFQKNIDDKNRELVSGMHGDYLVIEGTASALPLTVRQRTGLPMHPAFLVPMKRLPREPWMRLEQLHLVVDVELVVNHQVSPKDLAQFISRATRVRESLYVDF